MTQTTTFTIGGIPIPVEYRTTTYPAFHGGTYWLYGYKADGEQVYTLDHDNGEDVDTLLRDATRTDVLRHLTSHGQVYSTSVALVDTVTVPKTTKLTEPEVTTIQKRLRDAMNALDACGQDDLSEQVHGIFKEVARRTYGESA